MPCAREHARRQAERSRLMFRRRARRTPQSSSAVSESVERERNAPVIARAIGPVLLRLEELEMRRMLSAAPGDPDMTFGSGGVATTDVVFGEAKDVAVDPTDGSVVVVGQSLGGSLQATLARFKADGSLDVNFGDSLDSIDNDNGGVIRLNLGNFDEIDRVQILSGGKILVAGHSADAGLGDNSTVFVGEFNADGTPVTDFAAGGVSFLPNVDGDVVGMAVRANGKIVVAVNLGGQSGGQIAQLVDPAGSGPVQYDTSWGVGGVEPVLGLGADLRAIALQTILSGEYVVAAGEVLTPDANVVVSRLNLSGTGVDSTFGTLGTTTTDLGDAEAVAGVAVDSQDRIYVAVGHLETANADSRLSV